MELRIWLLVNCIENLLLKSGRTLFVFSSSPRPFSLPRHYATEIFRGRKRGKEVFLLEKHFLDVPKRSSHRNIQ